MTAAAEIAQASSLWCDEVPGLCAVADATASVGLALGDGNRESRVPLVAFVLTGHGRIWSGERFIDTAVGSRLMLRGHETVGDGDWRGATIRPTDPQTGLAAHVVLATVPGPGFPAQPGASGRRGGAPPAHPSRNRRPAASRVAVMERFSRSKMGCMTEIDGVVSVDDG